MINSGAALNTANYHFMEAAIQQYPHIVKQVYLPDNNTAIILFGIVSSPTNGLITTISVGFELHLSYHTKDGSNTSLLVAAGPDVAVNVILGLPFIKATSIIANFVGNVCKAKYLWLQSVPHQLQARNKVYPCFSGQQRLHVYQCIQQKSNPHPWYAQCLLFLQGRRASHSYHDPAPIQISACKLSANSQGDKDNSKIIRFGNQQISLSKSAITINDYNSGVLGDLGYL
jgi:hypothetical protein